MKFLKQLMPLIVYGWRYRDRIDEVIDLLSYIFEAGKDGKISSKEFVELQRKFWKVVKG
jgi:hypothetical protein